MVNFKALPNNQKALLIAAAAVLVALIVLLLVLFIPWSGENAGESSVPSGESGQLVVNPAGLDDNQSVAGLDDTDKTDPYGSSSTSGTTSSEHANYTGPSAAHVEEGSKTPPPTTTAPNDKVTPGTKPTDPPKKDTVTPGTADAKEDYTPEEGAPHYGVTDETYPEPDTPDVEGEEKPVEDFIDDNGRPGEGIHF